VDSKEEKSKQLEQASQPIWAMFEFVVSGRMKVENTLALFLAINTLFIVAFLELFKTELTTLSLAYLIPFLLLVLPSLAMFATFASRSIQVPWIDKEKLTATLDKSEFQIELLSEVYASADQSHTAKKRASWLLRICLFSVGIAIGWLVMIFLHYICCSQMLVTEKIVVIVLIALGLFLCIFLVAKNMQAYPFEQSKRDIRNDLKKWIEEPNAKEGNIE